MKQIAAHTERHIHVAYALLTLVVIYWMVLP